ncbi:tRNA (adenosine(37)-N6)-dimethylallyltransferase MiaA [Compostibacter hankyongensis]|uniref:tRNA dimethylallyltransferase n=1 Tax=Compostibacter hankyongensis TaxID=1007089 RepID=A0ABP8FWX0_9BACT
MNTAATNKTLIVIAGPTAVGKTDLALRVARYYHADIISADSRQCYREMNIGTAKPPRAALESVKHYFIDTHSVTETVSAGQFEQLALGYAGESFRQHDVTVLCGGTGLYIKALCEGLDALPPVPASVRTHIRESFRQQGLDWLREEVRHKDPDFFKTTTEQQNPHRLMRALEVYEATGTSITRFRSGKQQQRPFRIIRVGMEMPRDALRERIYQRVDRMMEEGLAEEVKGLYPHRQLSALQTVGYRELFDWLEHKCSLSEAVAAIKTNTCRYAKRQMTWFRKDPSIRWFDAREQAAITGYLASALPDTRT